MIETGLAEKFIEQVRKYTDYNVNIMNEDGIIIASIDPDRVGQYHEIAYRIVHGGADIIDTTNLAERSNVRPGINMVIESDGLRAGVVGVTGDPNEIRAIALMVKMSIETMLKYEKQQEKIRLRENRKASFIHLLTEVPSSNPEDLRDMARELGYPEEMIRIPVLMCVEDIDTSEVLQLIRSSRYHTHKDFSIALDGHQVLVFKTMPDSCQELFTDYKFIIGEYLSPALRYMKAREKVSRFYIGSFQDTYSNYYYAYQHCRWLEKNIRSSSMSVFFYDHVQEYLQSVVPFNELSHIYYIYESQLSDAHKRLFVETFSGLINYNYNFQRAADKLFVHKNTLFYRYNKFKMLMGIDPIEKASDRAFVEGFCNYLKRM